MPLVFIWLFWLCLAFQLLLCAQLQAEVRHLAFAALAVLAWAVFTTVNWGFWTTPDVFAHPAVNFVLGSSSFCHLLISFVQVFEGRCPLPGFCRDDRDPLARATNTNEWRLIRLIYWESTGVSRLYATSCRKIAASLAES